jgi:hypothetical protein
VARVIQQEKGGPHLPSGKCGPPPHCHPSFDVV